MTAKMKNALVGSVGFFVIAMAFTLFAIPQSFICRPGCR